MSAETLTTVNIWSFAVIFYPIKLLKSTLNLLNTDNCCSIRQTPNNRRVHHGKTKMAR